ncbi:recQ-mediated genome instability protein 2-like [Schistocerca piceifrons]|uniref:recQ-mediated genome instability protein 2-like n=1 Tax=Schistocerca piceifrons TaxID=274613 RepID=UPI001F5FDA2E|nr:recQ-mediated genome instability protein 2-like [Schistocerca piceifrons]
MICTFRLRSGMNDALSSPCYKLLVKHIRSCTWNVADYWQLKVTADSNHTATLTFKMLWLQGIIQDVLDEDTIVIRDESGVAKICKCRNSPGNHDWITKGIYCSIIGTLKKQLDVPEVEALKLTKLDGSIHSRMWTEEVEDLKLFLTNKAKPDMSVKNK